ncbi:hypothetical protein [Veronia nyctiphanis]|uniref:hypothetical protein n=1 Tax=Veronia nyctiphanis TaxID=1278244 RepID=UPI001F2ACD74|nr:hypothetical protein [Veronia nyctiphanis]
MNRTELANAIYKISNIKGEFTLRSGVTASEYFDKYLFEANPRVLSAIAEHMAALLPSDFDQFAGLEMGGIPIATALSLKTNSPPFLFAKRQSHTVRASLPRAETFKVKNLSLLKMS